MHANVLHKLQGTPGDTTDESCCAQAGGEPVRADGHDDGRSEQLHSCSTGALYESLAAPKRGLTTLSSNRTTSDYTCK
jgi:hypothetical protein